MNSIYKKYLRKALPIMAIAAIGAGAMGLTSCNDFLDEPVQGNVTDKNYFDTYYKLQAALNATYDILQSDAIQDSDWRFGEATADVMRCTDEGLSSQMGQLINFTFNTSNTLILNRWNIYYQAVHRANQVIYNIDRCRIADNTTDTYRRIRYLYGQAKFLRAYFYFNLVRTFGGVPIRPEEEIVAQTVIPRSSLEECYAYIEKDLREAAIMLPPRFNLGESGKVGSGAAVALLMKVLLQQTTPGVPSEKWDEIVSLGEYFVDGKSYTFDDILHFDKNYEGITWPELRRKLWFKPVEAFQETDYEETLQEPCLPLANAYSYEFKDRNGNPIRYDEQWYSQGEFCKGSIFEINFQESGDGTGGDTNEGTNIWSSMYTPAGNRSTPVLYVTDKLRQVMYGGTDPRDRYMTSQEMTMFDGALVWFGNHTPFKYYTPVADLPAHSDDNAKNRRILRFVEVALTYAEALNETGNAQKALVTLNNWEKVRNTINNSSSLTVAGGYGYLRDKIWMERQRELAYEWERFYDIVRQGRAAECIHTFASEYVNSGRGQYFRKGINEIFPIPQTEIDVSNGVVTQNPGY